jgi:hypothetical protein
VTDDDARGLTAVLTSSVPNLMDPPDRLGRIAERVRSRRRRQAAGACAAVVAVGAVAVAGLPTFDPPRQPEIAAPTATSIELVDWTTATLVLPRNTAVPCPTGRRQLRPSYEMRWKVKLGEASGPAKAGDLDVGRRTFQVLNTPVAFGDLTGDGKPEALLHVRCTEFPSGGMGEEEGAQLLAVTMRDDYSLVGLGYVGQVHAQYPSYRIADGQVVAALRYAVINKHRRGYTRYDVAHVRKYSWNGKSFSQVAGRTAPLVLSPAKDGVSSPVQLPAILRGSAVVCPAATVRFSFGEATSGGYTYSLEGRNVAQIVDIDGDGDEELLVTVRCSGNGYDGKSVYLVGQGPDGFITRDVPLANDGTYTVLEAALSGTTLRLQVTLNGIARTVTMRWGGKRFAGGLGRTA